MARTRTTYRCQKTDAYKHKHTVGGASNKAYKMLSIQIFPHQICEMKKSVVAVNILLIFTEYRLSLLSFIGIKHARIKSKKYAARNKSLSHE